MFNGRSIDSPLVVSGSIWSCGCPPIMATILSMAIVSGYRVMWRMGHAHACFTRNLSRRRRCGCWCWYWCRTWSPGRSQRRSPMRQPLAFIKRKFMPLLKCQILQMSNAEPRGRDGSRQTKASVCQCWHCQCQCRMSAPACGPFRLTLHYQMRFWMPFLPHSASQPLLRLLRGHSWVGFYALFVL